MNISKYTREKDGTLHPAGEQGGAHTRGPSQRPRAPSPRCLREKLDIFSLRHSWSPVDKAQDPGCHQQHEPPGEARRPCCTRCGLRRERTDSRYCPQVCSGPGPAGAWAWSHRSDLLLCSWRKQTRPNGELPEMGEEPAEGESEESSAVTW